METITSISNKMAKRFVCAKDKKYALNMIMYDINYLVYTDTKEPLTYGAKAAVIRSIFDVIAGRKTLQLKVGEELIPDFSDIVVFFEKRDFIMRHLKSGIKQQCELN